MVVDFISIIRSFSTDQAVVQHAEVSLAFKTDRQIADVFIAFPPSVANGPPIGFALMVRIAQHGYVVNDQNGFFLAARLKNRLSSTSPQLRQINGFIPRETIGRGNRSHVRTRSRSGPSGVPAEAFHLSKECVVALGVPQ